MEENEIELSDLVERMTKVMMETMTGEELADLYNKNFGCGMRYLEDGIFVQDNESMDPLSEYDSELDELEE